MLRIVSVVDFFSVMIIGQHFMALNSLGMAVET